MNLAIRPASPADVPAITCIYEHAVRYGTATFELEPPDADETARRLTALRDGGFPYLVAADGATILGYAYAALYRTRPAYRFSVENSIYIDPSAHRRGVGRALLEALIRESERAGFRQMIAVIGDSAQTASIELHRACGFRTIGAIENVGFKFGRWLDTVLMQRDLGPGGGSLPD